MSFCGKTTSDYANHFSIAFIASTNITTDIQTVIAEALKYVGSAIKEVHINAEVFYLENYTKSLEFSLVKFCDKVVNENITAVVITDTLKPGIFNFIPWISSRLGIPVALMRNVRTYSSSQVKKLSCFIAQIAVTNRRKSQVSFSLVGCALLLKT